MASVALVGALLLAAGRAWRDATRPVVRGAGDEVGPDAARRTAGGASCSWWWRPAVSLWQFRLYGSPLVASASGTLEVDAWLCSPPCSLLLALSLAALGCTRPIGVPSRTRRGARRPGLVPALPMRQLARRAGLYSSASLVAMLGVSGLTLTAVFAGSWQALDAEAAAIRTGGDVRVAYAGRDLVHGEDPDALVDPFAAVDGVDASAAVVRGEARIGSDPAPIVALPAALLAEIAPGAGDRRRRPRTRGARQHRAKRPCRRSRPGRRR